MSPRAQLVTDKFDSLPDMIHILNQHDSGSGLIIRSYVKKFLFYTINNLKLVQFRFSYVIKADKKQKWKLKISNA